MKNKTIAIIGTIISLCILLASFTNKEQILGNDNYSKSDSLLIENYKLKIKKQIFDDMDSLTLDQMDSIMFFSMISFEKSSVTYSPDSVVKIFNLQLSFCELRCEYMWYSWIHYINERTEIVKKADLMSIDSIYILESNKYLILETGWGNSGMYTTECYGADLLSIKADSININPINIGKNETICIESGKDFETYLNFDPRKRKLLFKHSEYYEINGVGVDSIRQGELLYKNGSFILIDKK